MATGSWPYSSAIKSAACRAVGASLTTSSMRPPTGAQNVLGRAGQHPQTLAIEAVGGFVEHPTFLWCTNVGTKRGRWRWP